jgi:uncharacterized protein
VHLTHSFTIPAGLEETWAHFQDIATVAECFPGAKVTSAEGDDFKGTAKVKLGPVALQYAGSGSFVDRDEAAHRMVLEAKGKDKRGNGTAGATVSLSFAQVADGTRADVVTDLAVTGKPAQFGSRMMQEVSDKLLGQFVECLQQQVGSEDSTAGAAQEEAAAAATGVSVDDVAVDAASAEAAAGDRAASAGGRPPEEGVTPSSRAEAPADRAGAGGSQTVMSSKADSDDALDLGATVLPVIARMYGKQAGAVLVFLLLLWWLRRRLSR